MFPPNLTQLGPRPPQNSCVVSAHPPPKTGEKAVVSHQKLSRGLIDLAQICDKVWSHDIGSNVQGEGQRSRPQRDVTGAKNLLNYQ